MPAYHQAKHRIFRGCRKAVVNRDDPLTLPLVAPEVQVISWRMAEPELGGFGLRMVDGQECLCHDFEALLPCADLPLAGRHNVANALAALAIGFSAGLSLASMVITLRNFEGLPHRARQVAEINGVRYVDDSKGTNVGATLAALNGLGGERDVVLIAGGQGKGADFSPLRQAVTRHCRHLVLIGEDAPLLEQALKSCAPVVSCASMEDAVASAAAQARPGDCVLLSPACASFDMFRGYVQRGEAFIAAVQRLPQGAS